MGNNAELCISNRRSQFQHSHQQHPPQLVPPGPSPRRSHKNLNFKATCQTSLAARRFREASISNDRNFRHKLCARQPWHLSAVRIGAAAARTPQWQTYQGMQKSMFSPPFLRPVPFDPSVLFGSSMACQAPVGMGWGWGGSKGQSTAAGHKVQ